VTAEGIGYEKLMDFYSFTVSLTVCTNVSVDKVGFKIKKPETWLKKISLKSRPPAIISGCLASSLIHRIS